MTCILSEPTTILTHLVVDEGQKIPESHTESSLHMQYRVGDIHLYTTYILQYLHIMLYSDVSCDSCVGCVHSGLNIFLAYTHRWDHTDTNHTTQCWSGGGLDHLEFWFCTLQVAHPFLRQHAWYCPLGWVYTTCTAYYLPCVIGKMVVPSVWYP